MMPIRNNSFSSNVLKIDDLCITKGAAVFFFLVGFLKISVILALVSDSPLVNWLIAFFYENYDLSTLFTYFIDNNIKIDKYILITLI